MTSDRRAATTEPCAPPFGAAPRVDAAALDLRGAGAATRGWLEAALRGDVAPLGSGAPLGLPLGSATPGRALAEPLAGQLRGWSERPVTARDLVDLVAAWRATGARGLELGLSRAPRGRFSAHARPLQAGDGAPGSFTLELEGLRPTPRVVAGEATDPALLDALAPAIVDLLLAPDALVDLRLRVWR